MTARVQIRRLPTGIEGLDKVLGGGLPEFSFNLIAGGPGSGKTTLAHQITFANAREDSKGIYFTIFGEPPIKMLRYQQQFRFFDPSKINREIRFVHLGQDMLDGGLSRVLDRITCELEATEARVVVVDSFRSVARTSAQSAEVRDAMGLEGFVQTLALRLTSYEATTFLVGEYLEQESNSNPIFTVADGIIWLHQAVVANSVVRRAQVMKMRGAAQTPGLHTLTLSDDGMRIYPRLPRLESAPSEAIESKGVAEEKKTGVPELDAMLGGGIPAGYSMLIVGPSGSGKTTLATHFIVEGAARGEPAVIAAFDKRREGYVTMGGPGAALDRYVREGKIELVHLRWLDLSVDEALSQIQEAVKRLGATRVVIDSLSGFELALAPPFREDVRESLYRMIGALTSMGITVLLTVELVDSFSELRIGPHGTSFLTDGIVLQRYVEIAGKLCKAMTVVKMRGRAHQNEIRAYEITEKGLMVGAALTSHRGVLTGVARPVRSRAT
jgi:circadian clock protein KaiC